MNVMYKKRTIIIFILLIIPMVCVTKAVTFRLASLGPLDIYWVKLHNYNSRQMYPELVRAYEKLVAKHPERTDLLYLLGWGYYKTGHPQKGYEYMKKYMESHPHHPSFQDYYYNNVRKAAENAL